MMSNPLLRLLLILFVLCRALTAAGEEFLDPKVAFQPSARAIDERTIEIRYAIAKGYYLYRERFKFVAAGGEPKLGPPQFPPGKLKKDENFGDVEVYFDEVRIRLPVERPSTGEALPVNLALTSMGCADGGICYPPQIQQVSLKLPASGSAPNGTGEVTQSAPAAGDDSAAITQLLRNAGFWLILASFFGFGLLLAFTPCVLPMLPILSGIIVGDHGKGKTTRGRAFALSVAYVLGMAITYAAIGIAAGLTGTLVSTALQNAWVLGAFALVFVALSLSMFGFYELQLPSGVQSKLSEEANQIRGGSFYGAATMGALSALIVGPCVAAPLAGALLYIGQTGDAVLGGAALFAMALGMGAPLVAVGVSAGHLMPHAGPWMEAVKKTFGVILLATAVWFITPVIPAWTQMLAWAVLLIVPAIFLHALDPLPPHAHGWQRFWKGIGVLMLVYGGALLIGTLAGSRDPLQPLAPFGGSRGTAAAATEGETHSAAFQRVRSLAELDARLRTANKPVLLDFYADWCVSCKEMERLTFSDPGIRRRLGDFLLIQADVTANNADDAALLKRFSLFGPPGIIFFDRQGREISGLRVVGFQDADRFGKTLALASERS